MNQRFFSGQHHPMTRRQAMAGAGAACATATMPRPTRASQEASEPANRQAPYQGDPAEYEPRPEQVTNIQTFHLNFVDEHGSIDVARRISETLKRLGHQYAPSDLGALSHTIVANLFGDTCHEDGALTVQWHRPSPGHLTVKCRIEAAQLIADLPSKWSLLGLGG